jgi:hypothetical protein
MARQESLIDPKVRAARRLLHEDLKRRWLEELPEAARDELDIATMLDPRFKTYNFPGLRSSSLEDKHKCAMAALDLAWTMDWKAKEPRSNAREPIAQSAPAPPKPPAGSLGTASSIFAMPLAPTDVWPTPRSAASTPTEERNNLEKYLSLPPEQNLDLDVLAWWKARDHSLLADPQTGRPEGLPTLAKMARQYLGRPASFAGVERMFSKAGKLHDDLKASQNDESLEHALLAAASCV